MQRPPHGPALHAGAVRRRSTTRSSPTPRRRSAPACSWPRSRSKNEFKVTDEDIEKGLAELAEETGKNVAKLRAEYREKQKRDILIGMILEDKILDFIESEVQDHGRRPAEAGSRRRRGGAKRHRSEDEEEG